MEDFAFWKWPAGFVQSDVRVLLCLGYGWLGLAAIYITLGAAALVCARLWPAPPKGCQVATPKE